MHKLFVVLTLLIIPRCSLFAQQAQDSSNSKWSFAATGYYYFIPDDKNFPTLIGSADHKKLHLEARYNYEDRNTASLFAGWRFETGTKFQFAATPMIGTAFGNTNGIVPALELNASYKILEFYAECEYLIDLAGNENNFFYTWSELSVRPIDALRTGISVQRTRLYKTDLDVERGIFAEYSFWKLRAAVYYFAPFSTGNFLIASLGIDL